MTEWKEFGWCEFFAGGFQELEAAGLLPGRVLFASRENYRVVSPLGEKHASLSGVARTVTKDGCLPVVGDWVALSADGRVIHHTLPRKTALFRKQPGEKMQKQVLAANVDVVFLVTGLDGDYSLRRIERYLTLAYESGARPVVILNKADLINDPSLPQQKSETVAPGVPVLVVSASEGWGLAALEAQMRVGQTAAFLGSSGAGKSTIINLLLSDAATQLAVGPVRTSDSRGRHTTTERSLHRTRRDWLVIDTPGLREIQLWADEQALEEAFEDIDSLSRFCRFRDCSHRGEPGCAVSEAVAKGQLAQDRHYSYLKLKRELENLEIRMDERKAAEKNRRDRALHRAMRDVLKRKGRY